MMRRRAGRCAGRAGDQEDRKRRNADYLLK
jgi:hypothetical protein